VGGEPGRVEVEHDALALAEHPEQGPLKGVSSQFMLGK
jgi:hypothetical protein